LAYIFVSVTALWLPQRPTYQLWQKYYSQHEKKARLAWSMEHLFIIYLFSTDMHACTTYIYNKQLQSVRHGQKAPRSTNNCPSRVCKSII